MREIKFRAWDKFMKFMWGTDVCYQGHLATFFKEYQDAVDGENEPILMQYTGLKDKNGKEIYEGDIVKKEWIEFTNKEHREQIVDVQWITNGYGAIFHEPEKLEVIGNIYENPGLLGGGAQ